MTKTTDTNASNIRFFFNGLKVGKGKLQRGSWSLIERWTPKGTGRVIETQVVLYGKGYQGFSSEITGVFGVENNSDSMTDYFETDRIRFTLGSSFFAQAAAAYRKALEKDLARCIKKGNLQAAESYTSQLLRLQNVVDGKVA